MAQIAESCPLLYMFIFYEEYLEVERNTLLKLAHAKLI